MDFIGRLRSFFELWPPFLRSRCLWRAVMLSHHAATVGWLRQDVCRDVRMLTATVVVSGVGVGLLTALTKPDLEHHLPCSALTSLAYRRAVAFAVANAAMEKHSRRHDGSAGQRSVTATGRSLSGGVVRRTTYLTGFPAACWGFSWFGVWIHVRVIRRRSSGQLAPWIAQGMTDIAIFPS